MRTAAFGGQGTYRLGEDGGRPGDGPVLRAVERAAHCRRLVPPHGALRSAALGDEEVNKDRLYRGLDHLLAHKAALEAHLSKRCGELFAVQNEVLLYDVTSTYFEGQRKAIRRPSAAIPATIAPTASKCASRSW